MCGISVIINQHCTLKFIFKTEPKILNLSTHTKTKTVKFMTETETLKIASRDVKKTSIRDLNIENIESPALTTDIVWALACKVSLCLSMAVDCWTCGDPS